MKFWFNNRKTFALKPAIFFHIQKTAGSSLVDVARQYYGPSVVSHGDFWDRRPEDLCKIDFISGHFGYHYAKSLMKNRYSFTFLRDPIQRILSFYAFCRSRDPEQFITYRLAHELSLVEFLNAGLTDYWIKNFGIWNNQVWQLAHGYAQFDSRVIDDFDGMELLELACDNIAKFDYVGFTESFERDSQAILRALGIIDVPEIPRSNETKNKINQNELSSDEKSLLLALTCLDREFFTRCKTLYSNPTIQN